MENREHVYTRDEQRVADYIVERSGNNMGGGDDPIGFLIASHTYLGDQLKERTVANGAWRAIADETPETRGTFLVWAEGRSIQILQWDIEDDEEGFRAGYDWQEWPTHWAPFKGPDADMLK